MPPILEQVNAEPQGTGSFLRRAAEAILQEHWPEAQGLIFDSGPPAHEVRQMKKQELAESMAGGPGWAQTNAAPHQWQALSEAVREPPQGAGAAGREVGPEFFGLEEFPQEHPDAITPREMQHNVFIQRQREMKKARAMKKLLRLEEETGKEFDFVFPWEEPVI